MMNARIYIKIFMAILFLGMMPSCTYDTLHVGGLDEHANVTLSLSLGDQPVLVSRAAVAGEGTENRIESVDLFFYKQTDGQPLVVPNNKISLSGNTLSLSMPVDEFNELFDINKTGVTAKTECQVYAIVNIGTNALPADGDYSLTNLQEMVLYAAFVDENGVIKTQDSFVMDGLATITRSGSTLNGEILLTRAAAKIGMQLVDAEGKNTQTLTVKDANGNAEWTADASAVQISLRRGSSRAYLRTAGYSAQSADIFSTAYTNLVTGTGDQAKYVSLYTYPTNWSNNENARTHLMVKVTWTEANVAVGETAETKTTYYEVNVNPADPFLQRNYFYQILQEISVLGSENEEEPVTLENASYKVLNWGAASSQGDLIRQRYLVVEETSVEMQNIVEKTIYFDSSDPIDLTKVEVLWNYTAENNARDLSMATAQVSRATNANTGDVTVTTSGNGSRDEVLSNGNIVYTITNTAAVSGVTNRIQTRGGVDYKVYITIHNADATNPNDRGYIKVQHNLDNLMQSTSDYTVYTIKLDVAHQDNASYKEAVNIKQYPMLSIVADQNTTYSSNAGRGYVYVNGSNTSNTNWMSVQGDLQLNRCPNRYIISVTSLNNTEIGRSYIIGDPRTDSRKISINNNQLTNYLPTDVSNSTQNMISPQYMFASSYGACPDAMSKEDAERRCATYQEDGYPAGRWRIPTKAEIKFAVQLKTWGNIPELFSSSIQYWSAQGKTYGTTSNNNDNNDNSGEVRVRCVYDTWYWGTDHVAGSTTYNYDDTRD